MSVVQIEDMIQSNKGLVWAQIHRYYLSEDPEAESLGMEALWNAAQTFDLSKNIKFSTYATVCIYNALGSYVRGLNSKNKLEIISYNNRSQNGEGGEYLENIEAGNTPEELLSREERMKLINQVFDEQLELLSSKQRVIVEAWKESDFSAQKTEIAKQVGVSQSYVSSTLQVFKNRLKIEFELEELFDV